MSAIAANDELTVEDELPTAAPLSGLDRCDSCGAQAYIRVGLGDGELLSCAHHGREVRAKLEPIASFWHDESARLLED